jgi:hypothetical protein
MTSTEALAKRSPGFRLWLLFVSEHIEASGVSLQYAQSLYSFAQAYEHAMTPYEAASNCLTWLNGRK